MNQLSEWPGEAGGVSHEDDREWQITMCRESPLCLGVEM